MYFGSLDIARRAVEYEREALGTVRSQAAKTASASFWAKKQEEKLKATVAKAKADLAIAKAQKLLSSKKPAGFKTDKATAVVALPALQQKAEAGRVQLEKLKMEAAQVLPTVEPETRQILEAQVAQASADQVAAEREVELAAEGVVRADAPAPAVDPSMAVPGPEEVETDAIMTEGEIEEEIKSASFFTPGALGALTPWVGAGIAAAIAFSWWRNRG